VSAAVVLHINDGYRGSRSTIICICIVSLRQSVSLPPHLQLYPLMPSAPHLHCWTVRPSVRPSVRPRTRRRPIAIASALHHHHHTPSWPQGGREGGREETERTKGRSHHLRCVYMTSLSILYLSYRPDAKEVSMVFISGRLTTEFTVFLRI
jgi:hypothetical protein